jgi:hypothetical protein
MAKTTQSVEYASQVASAIKFGDRIDDARTIEGSFQTATIKVVMDAANVATDVITLIQLPPGAIVLPQLSRVVVTDDMNDGAMTIDIGDIVDPDRYADGVDVAATGIKEFLTSAIAADGFVNPLKVAATGVSTTDTSLITCTIATEAGTMEAGTFYVVLAYKNL